MIPTYGFGDAQTGAHSVFSFQDNDLPCKGLVGCEQRYKEIASVATLAGPTSFAPLIDQAVKIVRETKEYHILLIIADGQVSESEVKATTEAIVQASNYALSIVMVGIGDGPWDLMEKFDDELPERRFDNFQFVEFNSVFTKYPKERREVAFATHALMEVPQQYQAVKRLRLLSKDSASESVKSVPAPLQPPTSQSYQQLASNLPGDWICTWNPEHKRHYYLSWETRQTSWEKPRTGRDTHKASFAPKGKVSHSSLQHSAWVSGSKVPLHVGTAR